MDYLKILNKYLYIKAPTISLILNFSLPFFLLLLGALLFLRTEWMLEFTSWFEKRVGAVWIPTTKTYFLYKWSGVVLLALGSGWLGYVFASWSP